MKNLILIFATLLSLTAFAEDPKQPFKVYGTDGPFPGIKEAADAFAAANSVKVDLVYGPMPKWKSEALKDADIIYSSSENAMDTYNDELGIIDDKTLTTTFMRPAAILVRKGNPKKIKNLKDLISRDLKVIIINGGGQVAMWEDMVGRMKDIQSITDFRKRVVFTGRNSPEATQYWKNHDEVDAWITFATWAKRDEIIEADVVNIEKDLVVYRSMNVAATTITNQKELALKFIEFMKTAEVDKIFKAQGWFKKEK